MDAFLAGARRTLVDTTLPLLIVIGNEAADLDSVVSAIVLAHALSLRRVTEPWDGLSGTPVPVVNVIREDLPLRTEIQATLKLANIEARDLICIDEIDLATLQAAGRLSLVLTDHNALAVHQAALSSSVVGIIDHHSDQGGRYDVGAHRIVALVGSCSTLVSELITESSAASSCSARPDGATDSGERIAALLLLSAILVDCVDMDPRAGKATPRDEAAVAALLERLAWDDDQRHALFRTLQDAKFDVSGLSVTDVLRRDYKEFKLSGVRAGFASVTMRAADFYDKVGGSSLLDDFRSARHLDVVIISFISQAGEGAAPVRELGVYSVLARDTHAALVAALVASNLALTPLTLTPAATTTMQADVFEQGNVAASRKQIQPLVAEFFSSSGGARPT